MAQQVKAERRFTKTELIFLRISPELKSQMISKSKINGKSLSEYIRDLVKKDLLEK